jgi:hypothetical protein
MIHFQVGTARFRLQTVLEDLGRLTGSVNGKNWKKLGTQRPPQFFIRKERASCQKLVSAHSALTSDRSESGDSKKDRREKFEAYPRPYDTSSRAQCNRFYRTNGCNRFYRACEKWLEKKLNRPSAMSCAWISLDLKHYFFNCLRIKSVSRMVTVELFSHLI